MRLRSLSLSAVQQEQLQTFADWLLSIGEGTVLDASPTGQDDTCWVQIPEYLLLPAESRNIEALISFVYNSSEAVNQAAYLCQ